MARGVLRLLVTARCWVLGTALPVENVGSKQTSHGEIRAGRAGGTSPPLQPARLQQAIQSQGEFVDSLSMCDAAVWEAAKGALTASQQSEIEEKRRVVAEQPTAHSARKQLEQEVAARSKRESAYQRQHKAAVNSCVLLAETGDKVKEQKTRVQLASVEAELETSREVGAHHAGCGRDVATLLSLLAAAIRKGQQQCYLPPGIRNQDLESFLTIGHMRSFFPEPQRSQPAAPHNAVPASIQTTIPSFPGTAGSRVDARASSSDAVGFAHDPSGLHAAAQTVGATPVSEGGERAQAWPQCIQFVSQ